MLLVLCVYNIAVCHERRYARSCTEAAKSLSHLSCLAGFLEYLSRLLVRLLIKKACMSQTLHTLLGTLPVYIQFIVKEKLDNQITFLDLQVKRSGNNLSTAMHWKRTHTERYLHFRSHHHPRVLSAWSIASKTKHSTFMSQTNSRKNCNICTTPSR